VFTSYSRPCWPNCALSTASTSRLLVRIPAPAYSCAPPKTNDTQVVPRVTTGDPVWCHRCEGPVPPIPRTGAPDNRKIPPINLALNPQRNWAYAHSLDMQAQPATPSTESRRGATCATQPASASLHRLHRPTVVTAVVLPAHHTHPAMHTHPNTRSRDQQGLVTKCWLLAPTSARAASILLMYKVCMAACCNFTE
jgi:hypothetical protein